MKINIAVPAYNEGKILKENILRLYDFSKSNLSDEFFIVIADNNSTDQTAEIAKDLEKNNRQIRYLYVGQKGKGSAIRAAWEKNQADIYCFMDADLATDLAALPGLVKGIKEGSDLVIGSRYLKGSQVKRSSARKIFSFVYHLALVAILGTKIKDMPCGFKAINNEIKEKILPQVQNNLWFFDSELAILTEKQGYQIKEIPVIWQDPREGKDKSRVNPFIVGWDYLREVIGLKKRLKSELTPDQ